MKALDAYKNFLLKVNKNDTSANINISKGEFVLIYNEQKRVWLEEKINKKSGDIDIHDLANLLVKDEKLIKNKVDSNSIYFKLPTNFFQFDSSYSKASKGNCKDRVLVNWLIKPKNIQVLLNDTNSSPSFEYEETLCLLSGNDLVIYNGDFTIDEVYLSFYKEPKDIDIEGYIKVDGNPSTTIDPDDIDDKSVTEIINRCAMEIIRNYENSEAAQLAKDRINSEN